LPKPAAGDDEEKRVLFIRGRRRTYRFISTAIQPRIKTRINAHRSLRLILRSCVAIFATIGTLISQYKIFCVGKEEKREPRRHEEEKKVGKVRRVRKVGGTPSAFNEKCKMKNLKCKSKEKSGEKKVGKV